MTSERAEAYGRVMRLLREEGPTKLQPAEQERIRDAADALFFTEDIAVDETARNAVSDMASLAQALAESGRWSDERARELLSDVLGCGPVSPVS
jgi:hypothetical protein